MPKPSLSLVINGEGKVPVGKTEVKPNLSRSALDNYDKIRIQIGPIEPIEKAPLITPSDIKKDFKEPKGYNRFIYWFMQDSLFYPTYSKNLIDLETDHFPKHPVNVVRSFNTTQFIKGFKIGTNLVWPTTFTALLLSDLIRYDLFPNDRYGNTLADIFAGTSSNQMTLTSQYGSDIVTDPLFATGVTLAALSPVISGLINLGVNHYLYRSDNDIFLQKAFNNLETRQKTKNLLSTANEKKLIFSVGWQKYQLWSLGQVEHKGLQTVFSAAAFSHLAYMLYSWSRLGESIINKIILTNKFYQEKAHCEADNKQWLYMLRTAQYECTVCGNWPFVYYNNVFSAQGCLDDLFKQPFNSTQFLQLMTQPLLQRDFKNIDLSHANWMSWSEKDFQLFLDTIRLSKDSFDTFNLSTPVPNPIFPQDRKMSMLGDFVSKVSINKMDMRNLNAGKQLYDVFPGFNNSKTSYIDFSGNGSGDEGLIYFRQFNYPFLKILKAANNKISNYGIQQYFNSNYNQTVTDVDLSNNVFNQMALDSLGHAMPDSSLERIDLSNTDLTGVDLTDFGVGLVKSPRVTYVDLSSCNLTDDQMLTLAPYLKASGVTIIKLNNNYISNDGAAAIFSAAENGTLTAIHLNNNPINNDGVIKASSLFNKTNLTEVLLADNAFNDIGFGNMTRAIPGTSIKIVDVAGNPLGDNGAFSMAECLSDPNCNLEKIIMSNNNIGEPGGVALANSFPKSKLTETILSNNQLTPKVAETIAEVLPQTLLEVFDASGNLFDNVSGKKLALAATDSKLIVFIVDNNPMGSGVGKELAPQLITPTPNSDTIGNPHLSIDEKRAIVNAKPATSMQQIGINNTGADRQDLIALWQVSPSANLTENATDVELDNGQSSSASTMASHSILHGLIDKLKQTLSHLSVSSETVAALQQSVKSSIESAIPENNLLADDVEDMNEDAVKASIYLLMWISYLFFRHMPSQDQQPVYHPIKGDRFKSIKKTISSYEKILVMQKQSHAGRSGLFNEEIEFIEKNIAKAHSRLNSIGNKEKIKDKILHQIENDFGLINKKIKFLYIRNKELKKVEIKAFRTEQKASKNNDDEKITKSVIHYDIIKKEFRHEIKKSALSDSNNYSYSEESKRNSQPSFFKVSVDRSEGLLEKIVAAEQEQITHKI